MPTSCPITPTLVPVTMSVPIAAGERAAFYIVITGVTGSFESFDDALGAPVPRYRHTRTTRSIVGGMTARDVKLGSTIRTHREAVRVFFSRRSPRGKSRTAMDLHGLEQRA